MPSQQSFVVPSEFNVAKAFLKIISNADSKNDSDSNESIIDYLESAELKAFPTGKA